MVGAPELPTSISLPRVSADPGIFIYRLSVSCGEKSHLENGHAVRERSYLCLVFSTPMEAYSQTAIPSAQLLDSRSRRCVFTVLDHHFTLGFLAGTWLTTFWIPTHLKPSSLKRQLYGIKGLESPEARWQPL